MRTVGVLSSLVIVGLLSSCGTNDKKESKKAEVSAPKGAILAVPVDANGEEVIELSELRTVDASLEGASAEQLKKQFAAGKKVDNVSDDLTESSTQSWFGWKKRWKKRCGNNCGYQADVCGNYGFCGYRPQYQTVTEVIEYRPVVRQQYCGSFVQVCGQIPQYRIGYQTPQLQPTGPIYSPYEGFNQQGQLQPNTGFNQAYHFYGFENGCGGNGC